MNLETIVRRLLPGAEAWTEEELQEAVSFLDGEIAKLESEAESVSVDPVEASPVVPVVPAPVTEDVPAPAPQAHTGEVDYSALPTTPPEVGSSPNPISPNPAGPETTDPVDHTVSTTPEPDTTLPPTPPPPPDTSTEPA